MPSRLAQEFTPGSPWRLVKSYPSRCCSVKSALLREFLGRYSRTSRQQFLPECGLRSAPESRVVGICQPHLQDCSGRASGLWQCSRPRRAGQIVTRSVLDNLVNVHRAATSGQADLSAPPLVDPSPGRPLPSSTRPLVDPSPGRPVPWSTRPLVDPSPGRPVPWSTRPLVDAMAHGSGRTVSGRRNSCSSASSCSLVA